MKSLAALLCLLFVLTLCTAQESIFPDAPYTDLEYIDVQGDNLFAAGSCELGMFSKDGGQTWSYTDIPDEFYRDMKILPSALGDLALLMTSDELWAWDFTSEELSPVDISDIDQFGDLKGIEILGDKIYLVSVGRIHSATAPDFAWEMLTDVLYDEDYSINATAINNSALYIGSTEGHLFEAVLSGGSYEEIFNFGNRVRALAMFDSGTGYATIQSATGPMKSSNAGASWNVLTNFPENALMHAYDDNTVLTVNTNRFYVSTDGGDETTYVPIDDANAGLINHASFAENGDLFFCGRSSTLLKSTNAGLTYDNLNDYNRSDLRSISFDASGRAIATGSQAVLYSDDEGENWSSFDTDLLMGDPVYINAGAVLADDSYIIGHDEGHALIKNGSLISDGGIGLEAILSDPQSGLLLGVSPIGGNRAITKSTDEGENWENKYFTDAYIQKFKRTAGGKIYCAAGDFYLISEDDGEDWEEVVLPVEGYLSDMALLDDGTSLFAIQGALYESTDAGENLTQVATGYAINNIYFLAPDHYIYTQLSSGNTSLREKHPDEPSIKTIASFCGEVVSADLYDNALWLGMRGGHIMNYSFEEDLPDATQQPIIHRLSISPNPITLGSILALATPAQAVHLQVFNAFGRQIISQPGFTGSALPIETSQFTPGVYIIRQEAEGRVYQSRLLVTE